MVKSIFSCEVNGTWITVNLVKNCNGTKRNKKVEEFEKRLIDFCENADL